MLAKTCDTVFMLCYAKYFLAIVFAFFLKLFEFIGVFGV